MAITIADVEDRNTRSKKVVNGFLAGCVEVHPQPPAKARVVHGRLGTLDGFRLDVLDAGDVEEVIFVIISEITFLETRIEQLKQTRGGLRKPSQRS